MASLGYKEQSSQIVPDKFLYALLAGTVGAHEGARVEKIELRIGEKKMLGIHKSENGEKKGSQE